jgi:uracil-DNA glycosylase
MPSKITLPQLQVRIVACHACPRLVSWREEVALIKRAAYIEQEYWGKPVPGFGDAHARLLIVGLAPGAHGANRTGRVFTGDRSGDWLFGALYRAGFANQPSSTSRDDGLELNQAYIVAAVRCVPPDNKPTTEERETCLPFLDQELEILTSVTHLVCLGQFAWQAVLKLQRLKNHLPRPLPRFGHGAKITLSGLQITGCYHPSQQNTFTGRLTERMLDQIFEPIRNEIHSSDQ